MLYLQQFHALPDCAHLRRIFMLDAPYFLTIPTLESSWNTGYDPKLIP